MPSLGNYRVEISSNNRAGCKDKKCKDEGIKLMKGELRFGTWVTINEHGSWAWRHWGCVSGKTLQNIRETLPTEKDGTFDVEALDGFDEMNDHPEIQEKIRRCINQGFIDPEDFNGDPEFNKLGKTGIRGRASKKAAGAENEGDDGAAPASQGTPAKKPAKRSRKAKTEDDEEEDEKPVAKKAKKGKKATAIKDETDEDDDQPMVDEPAPQVAKKGKRKSTATIEDKEEKPNSTAKTKSRRQSIKDEPTDDSEPIIAKKSRKASKKSAIKDEDEEEDDGEDEPPKKSKKAAPISSSKRSTSASKKMTKEETEDKDDEEDVPAVKKGRGRKSNISTAEEIPASTGKAGKGNRRTSAGRSKK